MNICMREFSTCIENRTSMTYSKDTYHQHESQLNRDCDTGCLFNQVFPPKHGWGTVTNNSCENQTAHAIHAIQNTNVLHWEKK